MFSAAAFVPWALLWLNPRREDPPATGAGALSGFGQGVGYLAGCPGPLVFGVLSGPVTGWWLSFGYLWLTLLALGVGWGSR